MTQKRLNNVTKIANAYLESAGRKKLTRNQVLRICVEISEFCIKTYGVDESYVMYNYPELDLGSDVYGYVMNGGCTL